MEHHYGVYGSLCWWKASHDTYSGLQGPTGSCHPFKPMQGVSTCHDPF